MVQTGGREGQAGRAGGAADQTAGPQERTNLATHRLRISPTAQQVNPSPSAVNSGSAGPRPACRSRGGSPGRSTGVLFPRYVSAVTRGRGRSRGAERKGPADAHRVGGGSSWGAGVWRPRGGGGAAGRRAGAGRRWHLVAASLQEKGWGLIAMKSRTVWPAEQSWLSCRGCEMVGRWTLRTTGLGGSWERNGGFRVKS